MELDALQGVVDEINGLGATLVTISPQQVKHNLAMQQEKKLQFEMLSDPGNSVAKSYRIVHQLPEELQQVYMQFDLDIPMYNNDDSWTLPLTARFIIDQGQTIRYAEISQDHTIRPEPKDTIRALQAL
jgi:peroxiredoxin